MCGLTTQQICTGLQAASAAESESRAMTSLDLDETYHWFRQASEMDPRKKGEEGKAAVEAGQLEKPGSGGGGELSGTLLFPKDCTSKLLRE